MNYQPHEYQRYAINFVEVHKESALLLDLGLGKSSIALTAINDLLFDYFLVHKVLVIAPIRVCTNTWTSEIKKWDHLRHLKYSLCVGDERTRKRALYADADIYIINRENVEWLINKSGVKFDFDMIVIDELSSFKNGKSKRFQALMKVRPMVQRIIGLTGTPSSNGLMDLWAEYRLLDLGKRLGRFITHYRETYFVPDKRNQEIVFSYKPKLGAEEEIYRQIGDITISMKAIDHLPMPELIINDYKVELDSKERKQYESLANNLVLELGDEDITVANAGVLSNKLIQMASGSLYHDESHNFVEIHNKKLDALEDLIEGANGEPLLVAYWFKSDLERIIKRLKKIKDKTDISFEVLDKPEAIEKWNKGEINVGLIHPQSAGHGLNLQEGGHQLIWFSLTWSLELYQQTIGRLYRQGQRSKSVVVTRIVAKDTIDENVIRALDKKERTQDALIEAVKAHVKGGKSNGDN